MDLAPAETTPRRRDTARATLVVVTMLLLMTSSTVADEQRAATQFFGYASKNDPATWGDADFAGRVRQRQAALNAAGVPTHVLEPSEAELRRSIFKVTIAPVLPVLIPGNILPF